MTISSCPGEGVCSGVEIFGSALLQPTLSVCISLSAFSFYSVFILCLHNIFYTPMARYGLFVLKVPLNTNKPTIRPRVSWNVSEFNTVDPLVQVLRCVYRRRSFTGAWKQFWPDSLLPPPMTCTCGSPLWAPGCKNRPAPFPGRMS